MNAGPVHAIGGARFIFIVKRHPTFVRCEVLLDLIEHTGREGGALLRRVDERQFVSVDFRIVVVEVESDG